MFHLNFLDRSWLARKSSSLLFALSPHYRRTRKIERPLQVRERINQIVTLTVPVLAVGGLHLDGMMHLQQTEYHELSVGTAAAAGGPNGPHDAPAALRPPIN
ncbi:hypothetical protein Zmor_025021 [Zophobas morio]|mgnify:CR=1 FL=1|uniref:Uncharacterized protein n=1 Tax=Zophobas morio TaxID=2755281 RepID=A0AA38M3B9_9CUCU|nr:hypothetical protein Zmor_025021 [Zophobas morio]